jgi:hypothetical protein
MELSGVEGKGVESAGYSSDEWEGLVRCERCGGWTIHAGLQLPDWLRLFRVITLPIGRRRYAICRGCGHRWEMTEQEERATRAVAQDLLSRYLVLRGRPGPDEKFRADEGVIPRIQAESNRPPMTVKEAEKKLWDQGRRGP